MASLDLHGKRALVTGGTRGIGRATAEALERHGAEVVVSGRTPPEKPLGVTRFIGADLAAPDGPEKLAAEVLETLGGLDILVNNAGSQVRRADISAFTDDDWQQDLRINLLAPIKLDRALLPALIESKGNLVYVSSVAARVPQPNVIAYSTAKAALVTYSKGLSKEVGALGVRVNSVFPGVTETDMMGELMKTMAEQSGQSYAEFLPGFLAQAGVTLGRAAQPEEIADTIAFLVSPMASYLTGTQTMIDGGSSFA